MSRRVAAAPLPKPRLARALTWSLCAHALGIAIAIGWIAPPHEQDIVDIEIAPPPPPVEALPAEVAKPPPAPSPPPAPESAEPAARDPGELAAATLDAGVPDAALAPDAAAVRVAAHADAREVDMLVADEISALQGSSADTVVAMLAVGPRDAGSGAGSNDIAATGPLFGSDYGSDVYAANAVNLGSGSGSAGTDDQPAVAGAPTTAGTAANLLAYMPAGHVLTALVRFDRLRGTEWAKAAESVVAPLPDYQLLFGSQPAGIADKLDMLVVSTPDPRDIIATTLVVRTGLSRPAMRDLLGGDIAWSATRGGMLGVRAHGFPHDQRVMLAPWPGWYVLAQRSDLGALTAPAKGAASRDLDAVQATGALPPWLAKVRAIAGESGDGPRGPALVVTLGAFGDQRRFAFGDIGLGFTQLPVPERISAALELVPNGWLVRGNLTFASDADAAELVATLTMAQQRIADSRILSGVLARQHLLDLVRGLSFARTGARVSYASSLSVADARAVLAATAEALKQLVH